MSSRRLLTILVALLMISAGCLGGGGDGDGASASGSSGGNGQSDGGGDDGAGASDDSAGTDEIDVADLEQQLRDAGSFTVVWEFSGVDATGTETDVTREFYADLEGERSLTVISSVVDGESDGGSSEQFFADGVTYVRSGPDESPTYFSYEQQSADVVATAIALSQARAYSADEGLTNRGSESFDGVAVTRYELSEADSQLIQAGSAAGVAAGGTSSSDVEITDFQYAVLVDDDGLPRFESYSVVGETQDGQTVRFEWTYSITAVGSTSVDDPDWLAEAKAQASS